MKQNYLQFLYNSMIRFLALIETFLSCELMKTFVHLLSSESLDGPLQSKKLPGTHIARSRECDIHWTCFKRYMQKVCRRGSFAQGIQNYLLLSRKVCKGHKMSASSGSIHKLCDRVVTGDSFMWLKNNIHRKSSHAKGMGVKGLTITSRNLWTWTFPNCLGLTFLVLFLEGYCVAGAGAAYNH